MKKWMKLTAAAVAATALLYGCGGSGGGEKKTAVRHKILKRA